MQTRKAKINRQTAETNISLTLELDGEGRSNIQTGLGFFDHMLTLWTKHGLFNLELKAQGDLEVDGHHTVEDIGICLGQALKEALGNKAGITRYGHTIVPMDEALLLAALDLSGRGHLELSAELPSPKVGDFETELLEEFLRALAVNGGITLHIRQLAGKNTHHIIEGAFKALGRALRMAIEPDNRAKGAIPSTKGVL